MAATEEVTDDGEMAPGGAAGDGSKGAGGIWSGHSVELAGARCSVRFLTCRGQKVLYAVEVFLELLVGGRHGGERLRPGAASA